MTWAMMGGSAVAVVGGIASQQMNKGGGGAMPPPQAQLDPNQKSAPLQPTAKGFMQPQMPTGMTQDQISQVVMPTVPQSDPLADYLKHQRSY